MNCCKHQVAPPFGPDAYTFDLCNLLICILLVYVLPPFCGYLYAHRHQVAPPLLVSTSSCHRHQVVTTLEHYLYILPVHRFALCTASYHRHQLLPPLEPYLYLLPSVVLLYAPPVVTDTRWRHHWSLTCIYFLVSFCFMYRQLSQTPGGATIGALLLSTSLHCFALCTASCHRH